MRRMFSLMHISDEAHAIVVSYPLWVGLGLLALAAVLAACNFAAGVRIVRRRWVLSAAMLVAGWSGLYFATFKATIGPEAGTVYAFLRYDHTVAWKDAADIYLEQQGSGPSHIVVVDRKRRPYDFNVADLADTDRERLLDYMIARMPHDAPSDARALIKRQAPASVRRVGYFSDQQI